MSIYGVRGTHTRPKGARLRYVRIWCAWDAHPPQKGARIAR